MLTTFWNNFFYEPLYNLLIFFANIAPAHSIAIAVILLTVLVKVVLYPLSKRALMSQLELKKLEPELNAIKAEFPDRTTQSQKTMELYKKHKINPFSGCILIFLQLPFILALYQVFIKGFVLDTSRLYNFVHFPTTFTHGLFGINLDSKSIILALVAGVSQYFLGKFSSARMASTGGTTEGFAGAFSKSMQMQMKYVFPFLIAFIAYQVSGAAALYWIISNIVTILMEWHLQKKMDK
jgi:YidC/Oxa1 family membrane protein insertase